MKKFAFALLITAVAASPAAAAQKKAKKAAAAEPASMAQPVATQAQTTNQNSANFAKDSLPIFLPSWSMPAYMAVTKPPQTQPQR